MDEHTTTNDPVGPGTGDDGVAAVAGLGSDTGDSMDLNIVVLAGRIIAEPERATPASGARSLRLLVAVEQHEPSRRVDVIPVTRLDPTDKEWDAEYRSGQRVWVAARVQRRFWDHEQGRRSRLEIVADQILMRDEGAGNA